MDIIIYSILLLFSFLIYVNFDKIIFLLKNKKLKTIESFDEKNSKRKKLGSPRKDK
jgi:hypothetical protein